eukprot:gene27379-48952_t
MKEEKTTPLRQRMIEDMDIRGLCAKTQQGHIRCVKHFASFLGRSRDTATPEDLRAYQLQMTKDLVSATTFNVRIISLRFFFGVTCGREEIEVIEPAVRELATEGIAVGGPFPADTIFLKARDGEYQAIVTLYHDQGQIAMKLIGFDSGVTLIGGFPFPICTPAHGTAYEIAGKGIANLGATRAALSLAVKMAQDGKAKAKAAA